MAIDPKKAQVAKIVCDEFSIARRGTTRRPLILAIKDGFVLDQMVTQTLLREEENRTLYFPTLGTFALLPDGDPGFLAAGTGTIQVLRTIYDLFETGSPHINIGSNELLEAGRKLHGAIDQATFNLGIFLVDFPGLGAVQGYSRMDDHIGVRFVTVSERIMMIDDPKSTWERCVEISRQNAQYSEAPTP